jgi:hypothetical protein
MSWRSLQTGGMAQRRTTACSRRPPVSARASLPLSGAAEAQRSVHSILSILTNALDRYFTWRYSGVYTMEDDALWQSQDYT